MTFAQAAAGGDDIGMFGEERRGRSRPVGAQFAVAVDELHEGDRLMVGTQYGLAPRCEPEQP